MKQEYDFSNAEKGKFYNSEAKFEYPIFLEESLIKNYETIAKKNKKDLNVLINDILKNNLELLKKVSL